MSDVIALTQALLRCPSVTPEDAGALDVLQENLEETGFVCHRLTFSDEGTADVGNLYARFGTAGPNFCFAGHTDVVPVGDTDAWSVDPFNATIKDGVIIGRGAADMKAAVAAFATAAKRFIKESGDDFAGSISLLITGDEEGPAINGTRKVLDWMVKNGEKIDHCIVGEPTNPQELGDMVKIGRRGSFTGYLDVIGTEGHVAYPHLADNPVPHLAAMVTALDELVLDNGTEHFQPSNLEFTTVDVGNPATNVIPKSARATFNIRFNTHHSLDSLEQTVIEVLDRIAKECGCQYELDIRKNSSPFLTPEGEFSALIVGAIEKRLGRKPELSTTGGTSDARFIKDHCPVAEFGLISQTMHKIDERANVSDIEALTDIYADILKSYFAKDG
ncbi:succinyl-diaminopimelate desuccinylase [Sneathiella sp.]|uniref:succinyl-diaminopimelate desuccinylase n=1 Tax=Sneathiella sp. TaxID=1964365 RepID=UPI00345C9EEF